MLSTHEDEEFGLWLFVRATSVFSITKWATTRQNLSPGIEILFVVCLDIILSNKRIRKTLIRLHGCAGWSVPLLFANPEDRFSRLGAHMKL